MRTYNFKNKEAKQIEEKYGILVKAKYVAITEDNRKIEIAGDLEGQELEEEIEKTKKMAKESKRFGEVKTIRKMMWIEEYMKEGFDEIRDMDGWEYSEVVPGRKKRLNKVLEVIEN